MYQNFQHRNINDALPALSKTLLDRGLETGSRNGACKELTHVGVTLRQPWRREILIDSRKPILAAQIAETAWVLAGRNDLEFLNHYLPRATKYSDDGTTWRAGYGPRLRAWAGSESKPDTDQLLEVVRLLIEDPLSRRAVMSIFDPALDFVDSLDIPCNNWLSFSNRLGKLDLHVAIRSNDLVWGWSGINAFEWSAIQEVVAGLLGLDVGGLHFSITSLHCYAPHWDKLEKMAALTDSASVDWPGLEDSPRFEPTRKGVDYLDELLDQWFKIEEKIRTGEPSSHAALVDSFPEPMLRSWLRVLQWWWTGDHHWLQPLAGTRLEYATHVSVQPPIRVDYAALRRRATEESSQLVVSGNHDLLRHVLKKVGVSRVPDVPDDKLEEFLDGIEPVDEQGLSDLLLLVATEYPGQTHVLPPEIMTWSPLDRKLVQEWAVATHLVASDNDVEIPELPKVLADRATTEDRHDAIDRVQQTLLTAAPTLPGLPGSTFLHAATALHNEKHAAYGDSWKRRGEMLGIMANIARKIDRLGGADTSDETSADTAMDLMIYLAKYSSWIHDSKDAFARGLSDSPIYANRILLAVENEVTGGKPLDIGGASIEGMEDNLRRFFDMLERVVTGDSINVESDRAWVVDQMLKEAYKLARLRWESTQLEIAEVADQYRGADRD